MRRRERLACAFAQALSQQLKALAQAADSRVTRQRKLVVVPLSALRTMGWGYGGKRPLDPHAIYTMGFGTTPRAPLRRRRP